MRALIACVDMDCFFAACEIRRRPDLKGLPLIVGAHKDAPRGIVCTASYEARKFGVHSAMPIGQAARLCPNGIFIPVDHEYYHAESKRIMAILHKHADVMSQASVDEAYLDVTNAASRFSSPMELCRSIRKDVYLRTGYTCSIGLSDSVTVAKIASGFKKPHGITVVSNVKGYLAPMPIDKMPGIGKKSVPHYLSMGIKTIGDLAAHDIFWVMEHFGKPGVYFWQVANGLDDSYLSLDNREKSISREQTFAYDIDDPSTLQTHLLSLCRDLYEDARRYLYKNVSIKVRYDDFTTITRASTLRIAECRLESMQRAALDLFTRHVQTNRPVRLVGVRVSSLEPKSYRQMTLGEYDPTSICDPSQHTLERERLSAEV